ncbi:response regulator [Ahrensia marina]|uniref:Chemotaxis protein CheY n=1 Tax=Ahrensia marina TaxID=1514904 RepID=A0A0M9GPD8_9HYPH|nr:response regulator [Ahrensia marina]KPB02553.1 chemotaxis protein CheY [Ahrensia marina]
MSESSKVKILIADDDADDRMLIADAFEEARLDNPIDFVVDGLDLLDYLKRQGKYEGMEGELLPSLILLDLNMPRMNGRAALEEIRKDPNLTAIPIIVLTTSKSEEDILQTYNLGINSFITKPVTFDRLVHVVQILNKYWIEIVSLPEKR